MPLRSYKTGVLKLFCCHTTKWNLIISVYTSIVWTERKSRNWKERLTMVLSYLMFPAVLYINKYASHFISF